MRRRGSRGRRLVTHAAAWTVAAVLVGARRPARADDVAPPDVGFQWGRVIFAPSLTFGYLYDTNLFLEPATNEPQPDGLMTAQPEFTLTVPFKNSKFQLTDTLLWRDYAQTVQVSGRWSNDAQATLTLAFSSHDTLDASARSVAGIAETTSFDPGGEVVFRGESFTFHSEMLKLERDERGRRGYHVSIQRNALKYDETTVHFFNYRGFDADAAYFEPVGPSTRIGVGYVGTRYDHFDPASPEGPYTPFREEAGDTALLLVDGWLGPRQPYRVQVGWEHLGFTGGAGQDFRGLVTQGNFAFGVGGGSALQFAFIRQPYRSFFGSSGGEIQNNFYVYNEVGVTFRRPFQRGSEFGVTTRLSKSGYDVPVFAGPELGELLRSDRTVQFELYGNVAVRERLIFRVSIRRGRRYSNFPDSDFLSNQFFGGFVFGWL